MSTLTIELWHIIMVLTFLAAVGSGGLAARLFSLAERESKVGQGIFGVFVVIAVWIPSFIAWCFLFQRFLSNVLKTM